MEECELLSEKRNCRGICDGRCECVKVRGAASPTRADTKDAVRCVD